MLFLQCLLQCTSTFTDSRNPTWGSIIQVSTLTMLQFLMAFKHERSKEEKTIELEAGLG